MKKTNFVILVVSLTIFGIAGIVRQQINAMPQSALQTLRTLDGSSKLFFCDSLAQIAELEHKGRNDSLEMQSLFYRATTQLFNNIYDQAILKDKKALAIATQLNDTLFMARICRDLANAYNRIGAFRSAELTSRASASHYNQAGYPIDSLQQMLQTVWYMYPQRKYREALCLLDSLKPTTDTIRHTFIVPHPGGTISYLRHQLENIDEDVKENRIIYIIGCNTNDSEKPSADKKQTPCDCIKDPELRSLSIMLDSIEQRIPDLYEINTRDYNKLAEPFVRILDELFHAQESSQR